MSQESVQQWYVDQLVGQSADQAGSVLREALLDPRLLLYGRIYDTWRETQSDTALPDQTVLAFFANELRTSDSAEILRSYHPIVWRKFQIISVIDSVYRTASFSQSFEHLAAVTQCESQLELIRILVDMSQRGIVRLRVDEKKQMVEFLDLLVPREVPLNSGPDLAAALNSTITEMENRFNTCMNSTELVDLHNELILP